MKRTVTTETQALVQEIGALVSGRNGNDVVSALATLMLRAVVQSRMRDDAEDKRTWMREVGHKLIALSSAPRWSLRAMAESISDSEPEHHAH